MAKKKTQSMPAGKATKKKVGAPAAKERPKASRKAALKNEQSAAETTSAAHAFDAESIGAAAGVIWWTLNEHGPQELAKLKKSVDMPADAILAAIGWLAREGKLAFETNDKTLTIALA